MEGNVNYVVAQDMIYENNRVGQSVLAENWAEPRTIIEKAGIKKERSMLSN